MKKSILFSLMVWATTILVAPILCLVTSRGLYSDILMFIVLGAIWSIPAVCIFAFVNFQFVKNDLKLIFTNEFNQKSAILGSILLALTSIILFQENLFKQSDLALYYICYEVIGLLAIWLYSFIFIILQNDDNQQTM